MSSFCDPRTRYPNKLFPLQSTQNVGGLTRPCEDDEDMADPPLCGGPSVCDQSCQVRVTGHRCPVVIPNKTIKLLFVSGGPRSKKGVGGAF